MSLKRWLVAILVSLLLVALIALTVYWKNRYDQQTLRGVPASASYQDAVKDRNELSKSINLIAIGLFALAIAPVLRRKDADITLDFSNKPLVWTLGCDILGAVGAYFCHYRFLTEVFENKSLGGTDTQLTTEIVPNLFDPAVSYWFDLQKYFLIYALITYAICLLWAQPWKRRPATSDQPAGEPVAVN